MKKRIIVCFLVLVATAAFAAGPINFTDIPTKKVDEQQNKLILSKLEFKKTPLNELISIDGKKVPAEGLFILYPGDHNIALKARQNTSSAFGNYTTKITLKRGSTYSFSVSLSNWGLMSMTIEKEYSLPLRLDEVQIGWTKDQVKRLLGYNALQMVIKDPSGKFKSESWSYTRGKESASVSFSEDGKVTGKKYYPPAPGK